MKRIARQISNSLRTQGVTRTLYRCLRYPVRYMVTYRKRRQIFASGSVQDAFKTIYELNWWGSPESRSGTGSTLAYTANLRRLLPELVSRFQVKTIYDAPCGDFNWMRHILPSLDVDYLGADIVPPLIEENSNRFSGSNCRFVVANIISDRIPNVDLWICRDCLFHFSYRDIYLTLSNFARSETAYLLTTTYVNETGFANTDIRTGDARPIDLFAPPFCLPRSPLFVVDDWAAPELPRQMVLFDRQQIMEALPAMRALLGDIDSL